jgi:hypothetical protein
LQALDKNRFLSVTCTVDVAAQRIIVAEGKIIPDPVVICAEFCMGAAFDWYVKTHGHQLELAYVHFDTGERFIGSIRRKWKEHVTSKQRIVLNPFWGLIADIPEVDMRNTPAVQAADIIAWAITRNLSAKVRHHKYLAEILVGTRDKCGIIPSARVILNDAALRST